MSVMLHTKSEIIAELRKELEGVKGRQVLEPMSSTLCSSLFWCEVRNLSFEAFSALAGRMQPALWPIVMPSMCRISSRRGESYGT